MFLVTDCSITSCFRVLNFDIWLFLSCGVHCISSLFLVFIDVGANLSNFGIL